MGQKAAQVQIYNAKQAQQELDGKDGRQELCRILKLQSVEFSKVYCKDRCIIGAVMMGLEDNTEGQQFVVPYYLDEERLFLVAEENEKEAGRVVERMDLGEDAATEQQFCVLLETVLTDDLEYIQRIETDCYKLEENLLGTLTEYVEPTKEILRYRKQLLMREFYYQQIADLCDILSGNKNEFFSEEGISLLENVGKRADRLCEYVQTLRDYLMQVWELYEQQVDVQQNKTMRILTVVTTIFLPLTLIAGWFGMNFKYMPELKSPYGYWITMGAAVVIAVCEIIYFKKKKYF